MLALLFHNTNFLLLLDVIGLNYELYRKVKKELDPHVESSHVTLSILVVSTFVDKVSHNKYTCMSFCTIASMKQGKSLAALKDKKRRLRRQRKSGKDKHNGVCVSTECMCVCVVTLSLWLGFIDLTNDDKASNNAKAAEWLEIEGTILLESDQKCIENRDWLNDRIIDAGQSKAKQHPQFQGFQSTLLGETLTFDVCKAKFVQVLNVGHQHWITISSEGECYLLCQNVRM